nr:lysine-specific demethylase 5B-B-like isoform X1 [Misgurnus anguillicaudatus]
MPTMEFGTTKEEMAQERMIWALKILESSVFDTQSNYAMCSSSKPPSLASKTPSPSLTDWIQCDSCGRWFHGQCVNMNTTQIEEMKETTWNCCLCKK